MLDLLKHQTQQRHQAIEKKMPLMSQTLTLATYKALLKKFFGFYLPLERAIVTENRRLEKPFDYPSRLKVPLLEKDLSALNINYPSPQACPLIPHIESASELLGCLYVVEGSTLGGQVISRHLKQHLNFTPDCGSAFFYGYGEYTGSNWKSFREFFNATCQHLPVNQQTIIEAANQTFICLDAWLFGERDELII